jgi:hypothetical protein
MTLGFVITSITESYHTATKTVVDDPRPSDDLHLASQKLSNVEKRRELLKSKRVLFDHTATQGKKSDRMKSVKQRSNYCSKRLIREHEQRDKYLLYRQSERFF